MQWRCVCVEENIFLLCIYIGNEPTYHNSWFTSFFFLHVFDYHNINKSIHDIHSVTHIQLDSLIVCVFHVQVLCMHEYSKLQTFPHSVLWQLIALLLKCLPMDDVKLRHPSLKSIDICGCTSLLLCEFSLPFQPLLQNTDLQMSSIGDVQHIVYLLLYWEIYRLIHVGFYFLDL